jgi:hypothetical protein
MQINLESRPEERMESTRPLRARIARFLSDRYAQRERPDYLPELLVLGIIVLAATWPIFALAAAMAIVR